MLINVKKFSDKTDNIAFHGLRGKIIDFNENSKITLAIETLSSSEVIKKLRLFFPHF
jgi:hypothetical protein